jgi:proteasome lid subunit RPN8/RPN11
MITIVQLEKSVADSILSYAIDAYPREAILLLRGRVEENRILIREVVIPPLSTHGVGFSSFPHIMLPMDLSVMGVSHSHPSGNLQPSIHDMNHFYGRIMVIAAYPFQTYDDIGVFNKNGDRVLHEIVPDHALANDE